MTCRGYEQSIPVIHYNHSGHGTTRFVAAQNVPPQQRTSSPSTVSQQSLGAVAVETSLVDSFCRQFLAGALEDEFTHSTINRPSSIVFQIRDRWSSDPLITTAMRALVFASFSKMHNDSRSLALALQAYSQALSQTQKMLKHPQKSKNDGVLAACQILAVYEYLAGSGSNWERHTLGINSLLLWRGPSSHADGLADSMFLSSRYQGIIAAIEQREDTFFSKPDWKQLPWITEPKDIRQELLDIMADLPTILAQFDTIRTATGTVHHQEKMRHHFYMICRALHHNARIWHENFQKSMDANLRSEIQNGISHTLSFSHFGIAHTLTLYWALCIILYNTVRLALRDSPPDDLSMVEEILPHDPYTYALCITSSIAYFFQPKGGTNATTLFSFPMGVALRYLDFSRDNLSAEYQKLVSAFRSGKPNNGNVMIVSVIQTVTTKLKEGGRDCGMRTPVRRPQSSRCPKHDD